MNLFQGLGGAVLAAIRGRVLAAIRFASAWIPPLASWVRASAEKYVERAFESYQHGDHDQAVTYFREALEWLPLSADFHSALGQVYYEQGRPGEAEEQFRKALDLNYRNPRALKGLGVVLHERNELLDAMYLYLRYVEVEPKDAVVCYNLGVVFYNLGKYEEAVEWYGRAEEQDPEDRIVRKRRAVALLALGRFDEARSTLLRAREIAPKDAEVDRLLGWALDLQGETRAALEFCESSLRKDSQNRDTHLQFASLATRLGRHQDAIEHANSAADLSRRAGDEHSTGEAYSVLGRSYYMLGDFAASLQASTEALKLNPALSSVHFNLGLALLQLGRTTEARQQYKEGIVRLAQVSDLKAHGIDDLRDALNKNPELPGAREILAELEQRYAILASKVAKAATPTT